MRTIKNKTLWPAAALALLMGCAQESPDTGPKTRQAAQYDTLIRGGTVYDGSGEPGYIADLAIKGERIAAMGDLEGATATRVIDASGKAVSPGFINVMGWGVTTLIEDGRAMSGITQGITLEIMGEGHSMGPLTEDMKADFVTDWGMEAQWTTFGEYLDFLVENGVSPNVASFMGTTTARINILGKDNVSPSSEQMLEMQNVVRTAMEEGALGVSSSLIYTPGAFASTEELSELAKAAKEYGGIYASHIRNEGRGIFTALDELISIARNADIPAEIYHLKIAHKETWPRFPEVVDLIESARAEGLRITADIYPYPAGATGLDNLMPPWANEGGYDQWVERMSDPETRARLKADMNIDSDDWENVFVSAGPDAVLLVGFINPDLQKYVGKTLTEVAKERGTDPEDTAMDLVIEDGSRVRAVFFTQTEEVVRQAMVLPWVSFCTDTKVVAAEGHFLKNSIHPRGYGSFPRIMGRYVREEGLLSLSEAIRKATSLPAENLSIRHRGALKEGYYADVLVFDPETIIDNATFENPHQYSTGIEQVIVNGQRVIADGQHTGAKPGQVVRGPGWTGWDIH
jgi:N-acyl-D-amino-acid deacylase